MSFNWSKFGQSMQKLSQTMLQGTILYAARDMRGCGGFNQSIWGGGHHCHHAGMYGMNNMYGMYGMGMPSPNIWHPMYSSNTTNPYLIQQGANNAENWGRMMYEQALAQIQARDAQVTQNSQYTGLTNPTLNENAGEEFTNDLKTKGEHTFVTEKWTQLNNKDSASATEQDIANLSKAYNVSISALGIDLLGDIDKKFGNNSSDNKLTADEFTAFAKDKFGDNATKEKIDLAFERLDTNNDGSITTDELTAALYVMDEKNDDIDGKILKDDYNNFIKDLTSKDSNIEAELIEKNNFKENS